MPDPKPDLTVVVPSVGGWHDLADCLAALVHQVDGGRLEILVADRVGGPLPDDARALDESVRVLEAPPHTPIPRLRALGFWAARADVVGVIEDHVLVPPDWARRMLAEHAAGAEVVGGSIENAATETARDWAAFLCEYGQCLDPAPGPTTMLPGNNVTYRRNLLLRFGNVIERGGWENELHDAMCAAGVALVSRPDIRVSHRMRYASAGEYASQRFLYSRAFAGSRCRNTGVIGRLLYGLASLGLPPVLAARIMAHAWRSRYRRQLVRSLPLMVPFTLAWAAGETVGAWLGPGDALARVR